MHRVLSALCLSGTLLASTACTDATAPSARTLVRFVNAISDTHRDSLVRLSFNGVLMGGGMTYRNFTSCMETLPGGYVPSITHGGTTLVTLPATQIDSTGKYTIIATGTVAQPHLVVLKDEFTYPRRSRARIRPFNALPSGGGLDMYVTREENGDNLAGANASNILFNASREFVDVPSQRVRVQFTRHGSGDILAFDGPVTLPDRSGRTVVVAGTSDPRTFVVPACL